MIGPACAAASGCLPPPLACSGTGVPAARGGKGRAVTVLPSGQQFPIRHGDAHAVVVEVGGGLRTYEVGGVAVLDGYGEHEMATAGRGQVLAPWPNRLHGSYTWDGASHRVPQDEPAKGNALHGLVRHRSWVARERSDSSVTMGLVLHPSPPYPFALDLTVHYSLGEQGLQVDTTATNAGTAALPFALGAHPYVTVGGQVDDALLTLPAAARLETDEDQVPISVVPVEGTAYDFRAARPVGELRIDHAFTHLQRGPDGRAVLRLAAAGGRRALSVWVDEGFGHLMVFTGDTVPQPERRRQGLAVEPMTAPPNAFVSGTDLIRLEPGQSVTRSWGIVPG